MQNLSWLFILILFSCKKPSSQFKTYNCDNVTSVNQLGWLKDLVEGKTECKIYPYATVTKLNNNDTTLFYFRNPGTISYHFDDQCSWTYFDCEGNQLNIPYVTPANFENEPIIWQESSPSPNNCDDITSIDQLPWAKDIVTDNRNPYFCGVYRGAYFAKYNYKGKTVFEFRNSASSRGGVCSWVIYDCAGNIILHGNVSTGNEWNDFFINKTNEKILWKKL